MVASLCFLFERAGSSVEVDSIAFVAFVAIDDIECMISRSPRSHDFSSRDRHDLI